MRLVKIFPAACLSLVLSFCAVPGLFGQTGAGSLQGTVHDPSGAVIVGAKVHIKSVEKGQSSDTVTNRTGYYSVPSLFTGNYVIEVQAKGFARWQGNVTLSVGQTAVIDPSLSIGGENAQVTVQGDITPLADYSSPTIGNTLENQRIQQLPMNGRSITTLVGITTPGVEGARVNGNRDPAFEYVQDGAVLVNTRFGGPDNIIMPDPDTIQEVRVETQNSSAKFNRPATAEISTKSGTNQLHGSAFETARNNGFGVAKNRQDTFVRAPKLIRNEFGASLGGPIYIPKLYDGRDKSFFFFAYERSSLIQNLSAFLTVPTDAMRQGVFDDAINGSGITQTIYDNLTTNPTTYARQPFPTDANGGQTIPLSRISPLAKALYAITPHPTSADNPFSHSNWQGAVPGNKIVPQITFRLDHKFDEKNSVFVRYTQINQSSLNWVAGSAGPPAIGDVTNVTSAPLTSFSGSLSYTHIFSPTFYAETVAANFWESDASGGISQLNNYAAQLGLPNPFGGPGFPLVTGNTGTASILSNYTVGQASRDSSIVTTLDENLTLIRGRHSFEFGGRYEHKRIGNLPGQNSASTVNFANLGTANFDSTSGSQLTPQNNTGYGPADFFLGDAQTYGASINLKYGHLRDEEFDLYLQDDIRVNSRLTFNAGLRWEAHPALVQKYNYWSNFDTKNKAVVLGAPLSEYYKLGYTTPTIIQAYQNVGIKFESTQDAGFPSTMIESDNLTFGPRLGFAYRPFSDTRGTVIRGGYATYIYPVPIQNIVLGTLPFGNQAFSQSYTTAAQSPDGLSNYILRSPQTVIAGANSSDVVNTGSKAFAPGIGIQGVNPHYPVTYVGQWNATIEQPLKPNAVLRLTYSGNHGRNLDQDYEVNSTLSNYSYFLNTGMAIPAQGTVAKGAPYDNTTYGAIHLQQKSGYSNDNSMQVNYQRLYKNGYAFQVYYTYSAAFKNGGNGWRDSPIYQLPAFAKGSLPAYLNSTDPKELSHFENYVRDISIPMHRVRWNGILDLPVGRGKFLLPHANRLVDEIVGGWQVVGDGTVASQFFGLETSNWGPMNPIHLYKHKYPVEDCRSSTATATVCHKGYLYYNGFINPQQINQPKGVTGIPGSYLPNQTPLDMDPKNAATYLTNDINVTLNNGTVINNVVISPGASGALASGSPNGAAPHPYAKTFLHGPYNWTQDLSLYKVFSITDRVNLKFNVDAFNVFNEQGYVNPDATSGIELVQTSANTARQLQLSARVSW